MTTKIEVCLSPADYRARSAIGFEEAVCVVMDVLRATSAMVAGLANGAAGFVPTAEISEALNLHAQRPDTLLAGERNGLRITAVQSGGVNFDLGNSPREYTRKKVRGRTIISTTTNGTRALRACVKAQKVVVASFLNLNATTEWLVQSQTERIILVCAGTAELCALEDVLGAGALCELLVSHWPRAELFDSAEAALRVYREAQMDLFSAVSRSQNGRRLMANAELRDDVEFCLRRDSCGLVALLGTDGTVRKSS